MSDNQNSVLRRLEIISENHTSIQQQLEMMDSEIQSLRNRVDLRSLTGVQRRETIQPRNLLESFDDVDTFQSEPPPRFRRNPPPIHICKVITDTELIQPISEICSICLESHLKQDSVMCNCAHEFGKECLEAWIDTCTQDVNCPTCRQTLTHVTSFRA